MPLISDKLAKETQGALEFGGATSDKNKAFAQAVVDHMKSGKVNFASGTITGAAAGGQLKNGAGDKGKISLVPSHFEGLLVAALGASTPQISNFAKAFSGYIMADGSVKFAPGTITGAASPGGVKAKGAGGKIEKLKGPALAAKLAAALGKSGPTPQLTKFATAICEHIMKNAVVALPSVTGKSGVSGPIKGEAANGKIS